MHRQLGVVATSLLQLGSKSLRCGVIIMYFEVYEIFVIINIGGCW